MAKYGEKTLKLSSPLKRQTNRIYALLQLDAKYSNRTISMPDEVKVDKCYCQNCQKVVDLSMTLRPTDRDRRQPYIQSTNFAYEFMDVTVELGDGDKADMTYSNRNSLKAQCPECGEACELSFLPRQTAKSSMAERHNDIPDSLRRQGTWIIPKEATGRYIFEFKAGDKITRVDDNVMFKDTIVFPSYKVYNSQMEISKSIDFINQSSKATTTKIHGDERKIISVKDSSDDFKYQPCYNNSPEPRITFINRTSSFSSHLYAGEVTDFQAFWSENNTLHNTLGVYKPTNPEMTDEAIKKIKLDAVFSQIKDEHHVFDDPVKTGILNSEHHLGQDNATEHVSDQLINRYSTMIIKYPVAVQYAIERANGRILNAEWDEKRHAENDPNYVIKEIPVSAKGRMFREEMNYVAEQLAACDDNILAEIRSSKSVDDMKAKLKFFAFGTNVQEAEIPKHISIGTPEELKTDPVKASKALKKEFQKNPIGVASNIYTCHKLGIKEPTAIFEAIELAKTAPNVNARPKRHGASHDSRPTTDVSKNADILLPMHHKPMLRFMKEYSKSHTAKQVLDVFTQEQVNIMAECVRLYEPLAQNKNIKIITGVKKDKTDEEKAFERTEVIKNYLKYHGIKDAYRDYVDMYGDKTVETVNAAARELKEEMFIDKAKVEYDKTGKILPEMAARYPDAKEKLDNWVLTYNRPVTVTTRNDKPLFENRNMSEIHSELAENLTKKDAMPNTPIDYTDKEKELEMTFVVPEDKKKETTKDGATWSITLMPDTFAFIRTASELHNCMGGTGYARDAVNKRMIYLRMNDETGHAVAAIEMAPSRSSSPDAKSYKITQFEADHDTALPARYVEFAKEWIEAKNIDASCRDCQHMGQDGYNFYGANADYHNQEIDDVTNRQVSTANFAKIQESRKQKAIALYGTDSNGEIKTPDVPDDLAEFA